MPIGYSGAPRVTQNNMDARIRRLSRSLTTGNNGTPLKITLRGGANTALIEEINFEAAPGAANTEARRPVWNVYSSKYRNATNTSLVNAGVIAGSWNTAGFIEVRYHTTNTLIWGINNTFGGGPGGVLYMGATGYMKADNTAFFYDETNDELNIYNDSASTDPRLKLEQDGTGDAGINFLLTATQGYSIGIDNSDSDAFKISAGNSLGSAYAIKVTTSNTVLIEKKLSLQNTAGSVLQVGTTDTTVGSGQVIGTFNFTSSDADLGTNTIVGQIRCEATETFGRSYKMVFETYNVTDTLQPALTLSDDGDAGIGATSPASVLHLYSTSIPYIISGFSDATIIDNQIIGGIVWQSSDSDLGANTNVAKVEAISEETFGRSYGIQWSTYNLTNTLVTHMTLGNTGRLALYNDTSSTTPKFRVEQDGTGDAAINLLLTATKGYTLGIDNSDSDKLKLAIGNTVSSGVILAVNTVGAKANTIDLYTPTDTTNPMVNILGVGANADSFIYYSGASANQDFSAGYDVSGNSYVIGWGSGLATAIFRFRRDTTAAGIGSFAPETMWHIHANAANTTPQLHIENDGTGDASMLFECGGNTVTIGIDNDDVDFFKILYGSAGLSTATNTLVYWHAGASGSGGWAFGKRLAASKIHVYHNDTALQTLTLEQDSTGDVGINFLLTSTAGFSVGMDNSVNDQFKIVPGNTVSGTTGMLMNSNGHTGFNITPQPSYTMSVLHQSLSANTTFGNILSYIPGRNVTSAESNLMIGHQTTASGNTYDIALGITDSGTREAYRIESFVSDAGFLGTLATQRGAYIRTGINSGAGTITNSICLLLESLTTTGTITNNWGIYNKTANNNYLAGTLMVGPKAAAVTSGVRVQTYNNDSSTTPMVLIEQDFTGDAALGFLLTGTQGYTIGIDNSNGDKLTIAAANSITSPFLVEANTTQWTFRTGCVLGFRGDSAFFAPTGDAQAYMYADTQLGIVFYGQGSQTDGIWVNRSGSTVLYNPASTKHFCTDDKFGVNMTFPNSPSRLFHVYSSNTNTTPTVLVEQGSTGDAGINFLLTGVAGYSIGIDNSDSDKFQIVVGNAIGSSTGITMDTSGNVAVGSTSPTSKLMSAGSFGAGYTSVSVNTTLDGTHFFVAVDATVAPRIITLPAASGVTGRIYAVKKIDSTANTVTVDGNGAETIDGAANTVLSAQWNWVQLISNGSGWYIMGSG